jgi:alkanesulfonate monooxygenase SsuD/methylene tetrahydromethanopterin reductase-like flavin-dependent oxidoreductase (luciferase family)
VTERHTRFLENFEIVRHALAESEITLHDQRLAIRPRSYTQPHPRFYWASTADESLRKAGAEGMPILFALAPGAELAERLERYRAIRSEAAVPPHAIDREIAEMYVLRRICVADTDEQALREVEEPLRWDHEMALRVHENGEPVITLTPSQGSTTDITDADCFGSVATVTRRLRELRALGLRKVIAWFHFGNMPHASVRRSMQLMATEVMPGLG